MNKKIFDLVYSDYDWKDHTYLAGPEDVTLEDFEKLCNRLLPKAGYQAALKYIGPNKNESISWSAVVESLISLLEEQGYQRVSLDSYVIHGNTVIGLDRKYEGPTFERLGFAEAAISSYNQKLDRKRREARKINPFMVRKKRPVQIIK